MDWTGRVIHTDRRGSIPLPLLVIFQHLTIDRKRWLSRAISFEKIQRQRFTI